MSLAKNLPVYLGAVARLLRTGGLFLNHGITATDVEGRDAVLGGEAFIDRYIFPGGELPHLALAVSEISRAGLEVRDVESLREHYALTLRHWTERLEARAEEAKALACERRYLTWLLYLAGCAHAFTRNWVSIHQILAVKPDAGGAATMPWTREYQYARLGIGESPEPARSHTGYHTTGRRFLAIPRRDGAHRVCRDRRPAAGLRASRPPVDRKRAPAGVAGALVWKCPSN